MSRDQDERDLRRRLERAKLLPPEQYHAAEMEAIDIFMRKYDRDFADNCGEEE